MFRVLKCLQSMSASQHPRSSSNTNTNLQLPSFAHFPHLHPSISQYLEARDIHTPTFIQYALLGKLQHQNASFNTAKTNYHIISPTGTGKTLAYLIPLLNSLKQEEQQCKQILTKPQRPRALVFTSNKELVLQARNVAKDISHFAKLRCEGLGIGRSIQQEKELLESGVDVLFTPYPRFKRMLDRREAFLSLLRWVVVDEVDTLMEGQRATLEDLFQTILAPKVMSFPPVQFQPFTQNAQKQFVQQLRVSRLLLSSTTNPLPLREYLSQKLTAKKTAKVLTEQGKPITKKYEIKFEQLIDKNVHVNLQNIKHEFLHCQELNKHETLLEELKRDRTGKIMIFCNTVNSLHDLEYCLAGEGIPTGSLHSQLPKNMRLKNYEQFRDLDNGILLATDLGARGLDFPKLKKVINYDFPLSTCDYLQRAGRTGRAGARGTVVSLYFKKHLNIINQLKGASFNTPLNINTSAYGFRNREQTGQRNKFIKKQKH